MKDRVVAATVRSRADVFYGRTTLIGAGPSSRSTPARDFTVEATLLKRRWTRQRRLGFAELHVDLPERLSESLFKRVQIRIARYDRADVWPSCGFVAQTCPYGVLQHIERDLGKRAAFPVLLAQHVVASLVLKLVRPDQAPKVRAEEHHPVELIAVAPHAHPDEMNVVGHEAITRTKQIFAGRRVKQQLAKLLVERFVQPPSSPILQRLRPMHDRVALVEFACKSRQVSLHTRRVPRHAMKWQGRSSAVAATVRSPAGLIGSCTRRSARDLTLAATLSARDLTVAATED